VSFTYDGIPFFNPVSAQSLIDSVRFLVGDTNSADVQLQDGEIMGMLTQNSSNPISAGFPIQGVTYDPYEAAVMACTSIASRYARLASKTVGDLSIQSAGISKVYMGMIAGIRRLGLRQSSPTPYIGGVDESEIETDQQDDGIRHAEFSIGMTDDPGGMSPITDGGGFSQAVPAG
jgi:hypothetical protein